MNLHSTGFIHVLPQKQKSFFYSRAIIFIRTSAMQSASARQNCLQVLTTTPVIRGTTILCGMNVLKVDKAVTAKSIGLTWLSRPA